jgi:hypothetical protein
MKLVDGQAPPFKFMSCLQRISNAAIARGDKIFFQKPDYFQPGIGLGLAMFFRETPKSKNGIISINRGKSITPTLPIISQAG